MYSRGDSNYSLGSLQSRGALAIEAPKLAAVENKPSFQQSSKDCPCPCLTGPLTRSRGVIFYSKLGKGGKDEMIYISK